MGEVHDVTWSAGGITGNVEIHYSTDSGVTYPNYIATVPASSGSYPWTVPDVNSMQCRVRVQEPGGGVSDESDMDFRITPQPVSIGRSPAELDFGSSEASMIFEVWNAGPGTLEYTVTDDANWVTVSPTSGTSTGSSDRQTHIVTVDRSGFAPGEERTATITISSAGADNSPQTIAVRASKSTLGSISGTVARDLDGLPISGLWVYAYDYDTGSWGGSDQTDANGVYEITSLASGTYRVQVSTWGTEYVQECYDDVFDWNSATPVRVIAGEPTRGVDFGLAIGATITGTVIRDSDGLPISGLCVFAHDYDTGAWGRGGRTDANGFYEINKLPTGTYRVRIYTDNTDYVAEYYSDVIDYEDAAPVAVIGGEERPNIDFGLAISGTITGTVTGDLEGTPISGLWVHAEDYASGEYRNGDWTDPNGKYEITNLPAGAYKVRATTWGSDYNYIQEYYNDQLNWEDADEVTVREGEPTSGIDFQLAIGGSIIGTVTDANGNPISNLWIWASDYYGSSWGNGDHTDPNGEYEIVGLPTGTYKVEVSTWGTDYVRQFYNQQADWRMANGVSVRTGEHTQNINFTLIVGASLSGYVKNLTGDPIWEVQINCSVDDVYYAYDVTTDTNGFYEARGLLPGYSYRAAAYPPRDSDYKITRIYVDVPEANDYTAPDIVLQTGALTVSGKVTDKATGEPLKNIWVSCHLEDLHIWGGNASTDASGTYVLTNLPPGEVEIRAEPRSYYACIGAEFELTEDINDLDFALPVEAVLSGKVLDAETAEPLAGIQVTYWNDWYAVWKDDYTNAQGRFTLTNLPPGIGEIKARPRVDTGYAWSLPWGSNWLYLNEGQHESNRIITLRKGALVRGYIKDPNSTPLSNIEYDWEGRVCEGWSRTDIDGRYEIILPPGTYTIGPDPDDGYGALYQKVTIIDIEQTIDVNDIIAYCEAGEQISGSVSNPGGYPKTGEFLIVAFRAGTVVDPNTWYAIGGVLGETVLDDSGPFAIGPLPPDANYDIYLCTASETPDDIMSLAIRDWQFDIRPGINDINLYYNSQGSTITGNVENTDGHPVLGATVLLADSTTGNFAGFGDTDHDGEYVIYNVPAGTYTATAVHSKYLNASTTVEVFDGIPANVDTIVMSFAGEKEGADLNGNGFVDILDVAAFTNQWLQSGSLEADFNQDSSVNFFDWARFAENWLWQAMWIND